MSMAHPRTLIRQQVVAQLMNATAAQDRVYDSQIAPHRANRLPAITVYTTSEPVNPDSAASAPRELARECRVQIAAWVAAADEQAVALAMDNIALEIENAMDADPYLAGAAGDSALEDTTMEIGADNGRSDPLIGTIELTYLVTYRTTQGQTAVDDFLTVDAKHQLVGGVIDTVPAEDLFNVQETP